MKKCIIPVILATLPLLAAELPCKNFEISDTLVPAGATPGHLFAQGKGFVYGAMDDDGRERLYQLWRTTLNAPWSAPIPLLPLTDENLPKLDNMQPTMADDGSILVFVRNEGGGWAANDLWMATRKNESQPFSDLREIAELNDPGAQAYPYLTPDGKNLYYVTDDGLMKATYKKLKKAFKEPEVIISPEEQYVLSCWVSSDELLLIFSDGSDLYYTNRTGKKKPFGKYKMINLPEEIPFVSAPSLSPSGELYCYTSISSYDDVDEEEYEEEGIIEELWDEQDWKEEISGKLELIDDEVDESIYIDEDEDHSLQMILILECAGGR